MSEVCSLMSEVYKMDGVVIIDKPKGLTSHDVVQRVKRVFGAKKAGHTGTLDPLATGVLPVLLNNATKMQDELMSGDKEYEVEILLGVTTDTYDVEGKVLNRVSLPLCKGEKEGVENAIHHFTGKIQQKPPYFSAVKHKGRPLYKWAREGKFIDLPPREVEIKKFEITRCHCEPQPKQSPCYPGQSSCHPERSEGSSEHTIIARITCTKGTYIRSICHDLGQHLGCGACMKELRRLRTGPFKIEDAFPLESISRHNLRPLNLSCTF